MKPLFSHKAFSLLATAAASVAFVSCETSDSVGSVIADDTVKIIIDEYNLDAPYDGIDHVAVSSPINAVASRTSTQLLGSIDAKGFGSISSDFVAQFMPSNQLSTELGPENVDSIKLRMFLTVGSFVGDSIVPMGLNVYRITDDLDNFYPLNSNFDPVGHYDPTPIASSVYNATVIGCPDSVASTFDAAGLRVVDVPLDKQLGKDFYAKYLEPGGKQLFNSPDRFAEWFKGIYVKNSFGTGRIVNFYATRMYLYLSRTEQLESGRDTTYQYVNAFLAVTPEVINNNNIRQRLDNSLVDMAQTSPVVVAPAGYQVNVTLPIRDIVKKYQQNKGLNTVVNGMNLKLTAEQIENDYDIPAPPYMLLVKKSEHDKFFRDNMLTNDTTSFYTTYNADSCYYNFGTLRNYLIEAIKKVDAGQELTEADGEFVLTPVSVETETSTNYYNPSTTVVAIVPYVSTPAMAKINLAKSKITVTYSNQNINNY